MADLAKLVVKLEAQTAKYDAALKRATNELRQFSGGANRFLDRAGAGFTSLAKRVLVAGTAFASLNRVFDAIKFGDDLAKASVKSGIAAEQFTQLAHAAKMSDVELGALSNGLKFMQLSLSKIGSSDGKEAQDTLSALGLRFSDIRDLKPEEQFLKIGDAIKRLPRIEDQTRAWQFFGKAGSDLGPLFERGAEGVREAMREAVSLGKSLNDIDLKKLQEADAAIKRMKASVDALSLSFAGLISGPLSRAADSIRSIFGGATQKEKLEDELRNAEMAVQSFGKMINESPEGVAALERYARALEALTEFNIAGTLARGGGGVGGFTPPGFGSEFDSLSEAIVNAKRIIPGFQSIYSEMLRNTATDAQKAAMAYEEFYVQLRELFDQGLIGADEFNKRLSEMQDKLLPEAQVTAKRIQVEKEISKMTVFAEQAARNMQDSFADFLFDPFDKGLKGMLKGFVDVLRRMLAEATAANLFGALSGGTAGGGLIGALSGGLGALFGKGASTGTVTARASGGPVTAGKPYMVGEEGRELFVPAMSGNIVPNGDLGGVVINQHMDNRGASVEFIRALPGILQENNRKMFDALRQARSRGQF